MSLFAFTSKLTRNRQTKQRRQELRRTLRRLTQVETLEDRRLLAAVTLGSGNLTIYDAGGASNAFTAKLYNDGMNDYFELTETHEQFSSLPVTSPASTLTNGDRTLRVPLSALTGSILIDGRSGNDALTIDFSGGNFTAPIIFNGGSQSSAAGDRLTIAGGVFATGGFAFTNANDGTIDLAGTSLITFSGLEPIVATGTTIDDLAFTFNGGAETITLTDAAGAAMTIDGTLGESVTFANPNSSLTINAGSGDDTIELTSVNASFRGAVTIDGDGGTDAVNWNASATLGSSVSSGDVDIVAETLSVNGVIAADAGQGD